MANIGLPYCGAAPVPAEWLGRWNGDPLLIVALAIAGMTVWRTAPTGRERTWVGAAFALLALLYISPLCALSSALFSVRVFHHVTLTTVVAPLLAWALPARRLPGSLPAWTIAQALVFWFWHAPDPYAAALSSDLIYWIMQLSLLGTAFAFWTAVRNAPVPAAIGGLLATMVQMGLLGALITFAQSPLYVPHFATTEPWGLLPLEDQQLAGLIMWVPGSAVYLFGALRLLYPWLAPQRPAEQ